LAAEAIAYFNAAEVLQHLKRMATEPKYDIHQFCTNATELLRHLSQAKIDREKRVFPTTCADKGDLNFFINSAELLLEFWNSIFHKNQ